MMRLVGLPVPSCELSHENRAKAQASWLLNWRAMRETGFTEQRKPSTLNSGGITGYCITGPHYAM
ncbi:Magnesium transporter 2 isoform 2 [Senna tora]|uniref:Magnesium transporter 2 isoform 2 n=1 Tax=Senna tora TaxID=362788 RepID=A0A834WIG1_9FABA|nr:Magnesium transporter 2 isoform 2 [Senna tora]